MTTTDVHDLGSFASLKEVWEKYPNGAQTGDYVFIDGVRYNWNKYEYQWFTPIATIDKNIEVFDISTYNFSTNDWRTDLADGEYTVIYDTAAVGRLLKYKDSFFIEGELAVVESKDGSSYTEVVEGEAKKSYSKVIYNNLYHKVVYDSSTLIYKVSIAEESLRLTSAEKKIESMQKVDSNLLNSVASLGSRATSLETWKSKIKDKTVITDLSVNENTEDTLTLTTTSTSLSSGTDTDNEIELPMASTEKAGIMTATDKENADKVPTLETTTATHTAEISSLKAKDKTLKDDIDNLAGVVGTHYDETENNTKNIKTNAQKIADNVTAISKANDNISANTKSIEDLQKADKELAENISLVNTELQSAEADITKHDSRLDTAETAIKAQEEKLESTINEVATNTKGIAENKTAISTNATNIDKNKANIVANTKAIEELQSANQELAEVIVDHDTRITTLEEKTPTMWANVLAVKDTAITVDGQRVELPAYTNVVIKDFKTMSVVRTDSPNPSCITKFDIHYNGIASIEQLQFGGKYQPSDEKYVGWFGCAITSLDTSLLDTSKVTSFYNLLGSTRSLTSINVSTWNTSNAENLAYVFCYAKNLASPDVSHWDTSKATTLDSTFNNAQSITSIDVSNWNTSKVTTLFCTFCQAYSLTTIKGLGNWDTSKVTNMQLLFYECKVLASLDLSSFDTTKVTNTTKMFDECSSLTDITFGEGFGKATASRLTLDLSTCGSSKSYQLTDNTYNTMLTMYDRATNGLPTMTIKFNAKHNLPDGFIAAMTARGYVISQ